MTKKPVNYRIRITNPSGTIRYIVRKDNKVTVLTAALEKETLGRVFGNYATELQFQLEDAISGRHAKGIVETAVGKQFEGAEFKPKVELF